MDIYITDKAVNFYKNEMKLEDGAYVTLFVRVGGIGSGGFSVGMKRGKPDLDFETLLFNNVYFCIHTDERWYFDGMKIDYDDDFDEMIFTNEKIDNVTNPK
ncbi:HesB/YadR/YfhF family protein [Evansella cellulosilytica]|uniref:HesB/YadR/YfhF-family protein n=1 Tax=Evansella cellulosilytica (strain ATCC 21833 / DSM 2522 / FERM P-1141 / JCM 9156 / N-4) TaxID=649639 RepID=E6U294_EVAC2|nr:iron-sulfur cluster biosynthesis family protein [Evansella cellulosilytica]ADU30472.1 HesB/YadR/YfhF-family protein [Evansella cellulosilytica DSM 2522]